MANTVLRRNLFVVGTRAQLIKLAPVLHLATAAHLPHDLWLAGQHNESIDDLLADFGITSLVVHPTNRKERSTVHHLAFWFPTAIWSCYRYARELSRRDQVAPLIVVHGDTLSALVGSIVARVGGYKLVHIESGLTSWRLLDPFPEEMIRRLVSRMSHYACCPNYEATARMSRRHVLEAANTKENTLLDTVRYAISSHDNIYNTIGMVDTRSYFVASIHRFQNIYSHKRLTSILNDLIDASQFGAVIFVLHPATEKRLNTYKLLNQLRDIERFSLIPRMAYSQFLLLLSRARAVFTDGGSNQEELSYIGVPTVLFRERSERNDGIGRNVVFRNHINCSFKTYIASGAIDTIRREGCLSTDHHPSNIVIRHLTKWSTLDVALSE